MARFNNKTPRYVSLPHIKCERTGEKLNGYNLPPGETVVDDAYAINALGLDAEGHDLFVIKGEQNGHKGIKNLFLPRLNILELIDGDEAAPLFPVLEDLSASEAIALIKGTNDRATIHHWRAKGDSRKTVQTALENQADAVGLT